MEQIEVSAFRPRLVMYCVPGTMPRIVLFNSPNCPEKEIVLVC